MTASIVTRSVLAALAFVLCALTTPAQTAREPEASVTSLYDSTMKDPARPGFGSKADQKLLTKSLDTL